MKYLGLPGFWQHPFLVSQLEKAAVFCRLLLFISSYITEYKKIQRKHSSPLCEDCDCAEYDSIQCPSLNRSSSELPKNQQATANSMLSRHQNHEEVPHDFLRADDGIGGCLLFLGGSVHRDIRFAVATCQRRRSN